MTVAMAAGPSLISVRERRSRGAPIAAGRISIEAREPPVEFAGGILGRQRHVCALFNDRELRKHGNSNVRGLEH
jgi:hypothetical protein